jgi:hypothetical protein
LQFPQTPTPRHTHAYPILKDHYSKTAFQLDSNQHFECVIQLEIIKEEKLIFKNSTAKQIHGTLKLHAFLPIRKRTLIVKKFSASAESE